MMKRPLIVLVLSFSTSLILAGTGEGDRLYRKSLDAYLLGKYDQAIVLAAQSLQVDPNRKKTHDLLTVLVAEKERIAQSEIWIAGRQPSVKTPNDVSEPKKKTKVMRDEKLWGELNHLRIEMKSLQAAQEKNSAERLMGLFEQRVQVIAGLLEKANAEQIEEIRTQQVQTDVKLEDLKDKGSKAAGVFLVLSLLSLAISVLALIRRNRPAGG